MMGICQVYRGIPLEMVLCHCGDMEPFFVGLLLFEKNGRKCLNRNDDFESR